MARVLGEAQAKRGSNKNSDDDGVLKGRVFKDRKRERERSEQCEGCLRR